MNPNPDRSALPQARAGQTPSRVPYLLVALLSAALLINYVDRGSISTAAPLLERQLGLTPSQLGWVLSAFFWAYVPSQPILGWFADHVGAARVLAAGFTLWSVSTFLTGLTAGVLGLVALRLLMGVGESVTYPSALALLAQRVTDRHRARHQRDERALWGGMLGIFCSDYAFYFVFTWLPLYLVHERGLSLQAMGNLTTGFYLVAAASVLATGWLLDHWILRGASQK